MSVNTRTNHLSHKDRNLRRLRLRMCDDLVAKGITDKNVLDAMRNVPRHAFVQEALHLQAYEDTSLPIGYGQTISQPYIVAYMTELLEVEAGMRVLEIGTGSGYQAAILAMLGCYVFSIERLRELFTRTQALLRRLGFGSIHMQRGDGTLGFPQAAPFDRVIVTAGGPEIPQPLVQQLDDNGILLIPVGQQQRAQQFIRVRKVRGVLYEETFGSTAFVNLVGSYGWESR
ncbi:MAG: protein-L-isoaspartate(D-aspartate) O-methyltransferase [Desulfovibrionaceae bacterium]|nr:protein-L-isoaspartate(D-aspartate) O-methyltransferase [Desulfovibrionaceae bacterium]